MVHWCSLTVHFIDEEWVLRTCLLDIRQLPYSADNEAIVVAWNSIFKNYGLNQQKNLVAAVTDGGSAFQLAAKIFTSSTNAITHWCCIIEWI